MAATITLKYDEENHSVRATPAVWPCKAWKLSRYHIETLKAKLPSDLAEFDICGVYLLLSKSSVYVGEAEQVITRLKQHATKPIFDWSDAIVFISKEQLLEKSHIKYLEHEIYQKLKTVNACKIENTTTPTRSHVSDEDTMQTYLEDIVKLVEIFGFGDIFYPTKAKAAVETVSLFSATEQPNVTIDTFVSNNIKAQDIARYALKYMLEQELLSQETIDFLCDKESARYFHAGGIPLLKLTEGSAEDCKDANGRYRYNTEFVPYKKKKYLISHELYNKPSEPKKDSRQPLLEFLEKNGLTLPEIFDICTAQKKKH